MAITDTQIDNAIPKYGDTTPHPAQPNQALMNELFKDIRNEALTTDNLVQVTGQSTADVMSQKAVTDELQTKLTKDDVVQVTGQSATKVMSQKAISDQLLGVGQTWQDVTLSREENVWYTNNTGRTIVALIELPQGNGDFEMGGLTFLLPNLRSFTIVIPPGENYMFNNITPTGFFELR